MKSIDEIAKQIQTGMSVKNGAAPDNTAHDGMLGKPDCPYCKGIGYVALGVPVGHPQFGQVFPCSCRMDELQAQRTQSLRAMSQLEALDRYTFETFSPDGHGLPPDKQRNLRYAYETARDYAAKQEGWLLLIGGYGCGKTHLAAAIANQALASGTMPVFVTVPDLLDHLRASYAPASSEPYSERFEQVRNTPLLILDDMGTENTTAWALEKLFQLLNYRYMKRLATVITTNLELERMDPRLRSRLADPDWVEVVTILAPDYRQAGVGRDDSDLNTLRYYSDMTLSNFYYRREKLSQTETGNLSQALKEAQDYADNPQGWLVFMGKPGVGKTHLAAGIANERVRLGSPALFIVVPDLLDHLRSTFSPQSSNSYDQRFEEVRNAPFLVLDDLGTESATPWAREKLFQLLNRRYVAQLSTVITTALTMEHIDPKLKVRLQDETRCKIVELNVPPFRGSASTVQAKPSKAGRGTKTIEP